MKLHSDKLVEITKAAHKVAYEVATGEAERGMLAAALLTKALECEEPDEVQSSLLEYVKERDTPIKQATKDDWPQSGYH